MDGQNLSDLRKMAPRGTDMRLFTDYAPAAGADHVPDPYFTRDFDGALDLIERCAAGLLDRLDRRGVQP
jgi:protein-tyrosine phosphatase